MSINDFSNKIKSKYGIDNLTIMYLLVIIGVSICSFGLGQLSANSFSNGSDHLITENENNDPSNEIQIINTNSNISTKNKEGEKVYVASKNGKLYYGVSCSGANRIKEENKVWFKTTIDAEKSGYTMSSSCK